MMTIIRIKTRGESRWGEKEEKETMPRKRAMITMKIRNRMKKKR